MFAYRDGERESLAGEGEDVREEARRALCDAGDDVLVRVQRLEKVNTTTNRKKHSVIAFDGESSMSVVQIKF